VAQACWLTESLPSAPTDGRSPVRRNTRRAAARRRTSGRRPRAVYRQRAQRLLDGDGASLVVHERADDYVTDPAGNAGARIACGMIAAR